MTPKQKKIYKAIEEFSKTIGGRTDIEKYRHVIHNKDRKKLNQAKVGDRFLLLIRTGDLEIFNALTCSNDRAHATYWVLKFKPPAAAIITMTGEELGEIRRLTEEELFEVLQLDPNNLPNLG